MNQELEVWHRPDGTVMRVHPEALCQGETCVVHAPTQHLMSDFALHWRGDRGIFERICPHGVGHPDPDQFGFWKATNQSWQAVHGCDGCCRPEGLRP